ncbi:MAG TPA: hypothetical protein VGO93_27640 [Candidatus Xenobia bacterium]
MAKDKQQQGGDMSHRLHQEEQPGDLQREARDIRKKEAAGEKLTRHEAGILGAEASIRKTHQTVEKAERSGHGEEVHEKYQVHSWTNHPEEARPPHMTEHGESKAEAAREKKAAGKKLTPSEAGALGGEKRAEDHAGQGQSEYGDKARGFISEEIKHHIHEHGMPQSQAVAAAMSEARQKGLKVPRPQD